MKVELLEAFQKEIAKKHGLGCCQNFKEVNCFDMEAENVFDLPPFENFEGDEHFYIKYQILNDGMVLYKIVLGKSPKTVDYHTATSQHR